MTFTSPEETIGDTLTKRMLTVKDLAPEDRPREKMMAQGKKALTNAELIAILIGSGNTDKNAVVLAQELLNAYDNRLSNLSRREIKELMKMKGIGEAKAISILAALELGYRMLSERNDNATILDSAYKAFCFISPRIIDLTNEEFWAIYLNTRNKVVSTQRISIGGLTSTPVDIRLIFRMALENNATSLIVCHNHPGGSTQPSAKDKTLTQSIIEAGKTLNIPLVDHIIVALDYNDTPQYYSFLEEGLI